MPKAPHVVVTGGGRGIGAATARLFKEKGYRVTIMARSRNQIETLADEIGAYAVRVDVGDPASVEAAFMAAGPVDVLVNNAGMVRSSRVMKTDVRVWEEHLKVNLTGSFLCALKVLPGMVSRGRGRIINVASIAGIRGLPYLAAYCASKHGMIGFTRALATEVGDAGVRVNAICPGYVDTAMTKEACEFIAERSDKTVDEALAHLASENATGELLTPDQVAESIYWLATQDGEVENGGYHTFEG
ncbi:MAG: SDR family oxidoreductase [Myxococcota bacterium]|nr:SDR family oxidoreductase [Myxococcota bacterium]MEC9390410.1 SDR family oxidoreductase [Myxococcota bacterium]